MWQGTPNLCAPVQWPVEGPTNKETPVSLPVWSSMQKRTNRLGVAFRTALGVGQGQDDGLGEDARHTWIC